MEKRKNIVTLLLKSMLASYILTGILLLLLTLLLYKPGIGEKALSIAIILIYVVATFLAGFIVGKKIGTGKYLWGLVAGASYFLLLVVISLIAGRGALKSAENFFTTFILCSAGGMLGGMIS